MHYKIKELYKIITILSNEEGLSEHGQTLLEGYAVGLENELASNTKIIGNVIDTPKLSCKKDGICFCDPYPKKMNKCQYYR